MPIFAIDTATTHVGRERRGGRITETRTLEVEGQGANGGRNHARFVFGSNRVASVVGYLTQAGARGISLVGWLPAAEFEAYRDILAAGGPLQVHYETRDGGAGYLRRVGLGRAGAALVAALGRRPTQPGGGGQRSPARAFAMPL